MVRDQTGRFTIRPFYENLDMEAECEAAVSAFLIPTRGKVEYPLATDDLTVLIERYADLDLYAEFPAESGIHGVTIFRPNRRPEVRIDRELTEDDRRINRLRTTLAHEFGHVRLHKSSFRWTDAACRSLATVPHSSRPASSRA
jgi:Zn-dependent peptidase ImmA (M78 family)